MKIPMNRNQGLLAFGATILLGTAVVYGCGDDDTSGSSTSSGGAGVDSGRADTGASSSSTSSSSTSSTSSSSSSSSSGAVPDSGTKPPTLGVQVDRFGRPAVNTALSGTFEADAAAGDKTKDDYNADGNRAGWIAKYRDSIAANLAIYDGLDQSCGNQPFADASAGNITPASRYGTLATVLADDRQWMNTAGTGSANNEYLSVELNATGAVPNTLVGGRRLAFDVIDRTYGVVSGVDPTGAGFSDGIGKVAAKTDGTTFPYLAAP